MLINRLAEHVGHRVGKSGFGPETDSNVGSEEYWIKRLITNNPYNVGALFKLGFNVRIQGKQVAYKFAFVFWRHDNKLTPTKQLQSVGR